MQNGYSVSVTVSRVAVVVLFSSCVVRACSIFYPTFNVGTEFRVKVADRGRPVNALRLVLRPRESSELQPVEAIYSLTDVDGYARFSNVNPGHFVLMADHDGNHVDGVEVEVTSNGRKDVTVPLKWPGSKPVGVRKVGGIVRGPDYYPSQVQVPLSISLLEAVSAREIAAALSDDKGRFNFTDEIPSGIYFLRINPSGLRGWSGEQIEGIITIEVDRKAKNAALDLDLGWSSCGLGYAQQDRYPEMKVSRICGDVTDTVGGVISNAQVMLMTTTEDVKIIEKTQNRVDGHFVLQEQRDGTYQLLVKSAGFQPFLQAIGVESPRSSKSCPKPIHVRLHAII